MLGIVSEEEGSEEGKGKASEWIAAKKKLDWSWIVWPGGEKGLEVVWCECERPKNARLASGRLGGAGRRRRRCRGVDLKDSTIH